MRAIVAEGAGWRLFFSFLLLAALAVNFWTQSRYPSLNDKAMMSGAIQLEDPLSFESMIDFDESAPLWERVLVTTVNWVKTNKNGMIFGVLFGAAFLTVLRYVRRRAFRGGFANSALGMAIGAPLGVCVNCAAPIAKGLFSAGARAETTLSAMIASPTLNVVVLTMAFSIMPFEIALTKLALSVAVIMVVVPLVVRAAPPRPVAAVTGDTTGGVCDIGPLPFAAEPTVLGSALEVGKHYAQDLWFIVARTVPLMLVAGFLGAVVANLMPLESFAGMGAGPLTLLLTAAVGLFLPVPIGFDVVAAGALLNAGLPVGMVMVLLFTLGIFSVYSFIIVGGTIAWRTAAAISAAIVVIAVLAGLGIQHHHEQEMAKGLEYLLQK